MSAELDGFLGIINKLLAFLAITLFNMWFVLVYEPEGDAFLKMCIYPRPIMRGERN